MLEGVVGGDLARLDRVREVLGPLLAATDGAAADEPCAGTPPPGVVAGIELFNARAFYACHETIEHEWHAERRPIRQLYQGILQIGVGFHHALGGNHRGALLLLSDGIEKTARFAPRCLGIETGRLVAESQRCLDRLRELGPDRLRDFDPATIPTIERSALGLSTRAGSEGDGATRRMAGARRAEAEAGVYRASAGILQSGSNGSSWQCLDRADRGRDGEAAAAANAPLASGMSRGRGGGAPRDIFGMTLVSRRSRRSHDDA